MERRQKRLWRLGITCHARRSFIYIGEEAAKQRVVEELEELGEKIIKLTSFLYGTKCASLILSYEAIDLLHEQLDVMQKYAELLQRRLAIWGKSDEELRKGMSLRVRGVKA